jgi:hypothetical protein
LAISPDSPTRAAATATITVARINATLRNDVRGGSVAAN